MKPSKERITGTFTPCPGYCWCYFGGDKRHKVARVLCFFKGSVSCSHHRCVNSVITASRLKPFIRLHPPNFMAPPRHLRFFKFHWSHQYKNGSRVLLNNKVTLWHPSMTLSAKGSATPTYSRSAKCRSFVTSSQIPFFLHAFIVYPWTDYGYLFQQISRPRRFSSRGHSTLPGGCPRIGKGKRLIVNCQLLIINC